MPYDEVRGGIAFGDWKLEDMARAGFAATWLPAGTGRGTCYERSSVEFR